jgi:hypothetical protein
MICDIFSRLAHSFSNQASYVFAQALIVVKKQSRGHRRRGRARSAPATNARYGPVERHERARPIGHAKLR